MMSLVIVEVLAYMGFFIFVLYKVKAISILEGIGKLRVTGLTILVILILSGQGIKSNRTTYPFSYWNMYSSPNAPSSFIEYNIFLSDGRKIHYPFDLVTNFSARAFMRKVEYLSISENKKNLEELDKLLNSLGKIYEDKHASVKIIRFEINRVTIPIYKWNGFKSIKRTNLFTHNFNND